MPIMTETAKGKSHQTHVLTDLAVSQLVWKLANFARWVPQMRHEERFDDRIVGFKAFWERLKPNEDIGLRRLVLSEFSHSAVSSNSA